MNEKKDILSVIKSRISKESKRGDKAEACRRANISTTTYEKGIKQKKDEDLTDDQLKVLLVHIEILDDRKKERKDIKEDICTR